MHKIRKIIICAKLIYLYDASRRHGRQSSSHLWLWACLATWHRRLFAPPSTTQLQLQAQANVCIFLLRPKWTDALRPKDGTCSGNST